MNNTDKLNVKILKLASLICYMHGHVAGGRNCQDWSASEIIPDEYFTKEEKLLINKQYEEINSGGNDFDPDYLPFHDEMMVSFMVARSVDLMSGAYESEIAELTKQRDELKVKAETFDLISNYHLSVERVGTWFMVWQGENRPLVLIDRGWPKRPQEVSINPDLALAYELSLSVAVRKAVAALSTQEADK